MTKTCAIVSFRLEGTDGVAIIAKTWQQVLEQLGWKTVTIAGDHPSDRAVDIKIDGLGIEPEADVDVTRLTQALDAADLVVCENILSVPVNMAASRAVARALRKRSAIIHHHDLPWQLESYRDHTELPVDDPAWHHVTINRLTQQQLRLKGIDSTLIYNGFDTKATLARRDIARRNNGFRDEELILLHPVRAIRRKNISVAVRLAEDLQATYWLTGATENGYESELASIIDTASCRVVRRPAESIATMYSASDMVVFPSLWEGFGNPPIEAAIHRRMAAVGNYPVSAELRELGFDWLDPADSASVSAALNQDNTAALDHNQHLANQHFSLDRLTKQVENIIAST